ncbi:hypothetical protein FBY24_2601 [Cellulomonas sp. SLBN-39]|nr:hypothetical protein FBY24_2601 [Cellulomonas sp. SLBN-39]
MAATVPSAASVRAVAAATGTDNKSAGRWLEHPRAEFVVSLARAYGADPVAGLVAAGFLDVREVERHARLAALRETTDLELAEELVRRASAAAQVPPDQLAARRAARTTTDDLQDLDGMPDAADDAPDWETEDEERERD